MGGCASRAAAHQDVADGNTFVSSGAPQTGKRTHESAAQDTLSRFARRQAMANLDLALLDGSVFHDVASHLDAADLQVPLCSIQRIMLHIPNLAECIARFTSLAPGCQRVGPGTASHLQGLGTLPRAWGQPPRARPLMLRRPSHRRPSALPRPPAPPPHAHRAHRACCHWQRYTKTVIYTTLQHS